jgi:hypothetical protein
VFPSLLFLCYGNVLAFQQAATISADLLCLPNLCPYTLCERKKHAAEAMAYNGLVQSWQEITRKARGKPSAGTTGTDDMFDESA